MTPPISVMIGVYNGAKYIGEAIESVLAQQYAGPIELIVVDDGSDDGSGEVANRYSEVRTARQERGGNGAARNRAVEMATHDYFAFLDADDRFMPGKLQRQMQVLQAEPSVDVVFGHVREFVSPQLTDEEQARVRPPAPEPLPWTAPNLMLIRRAAFERVGPFSEELRVGVTVDWFARASEAGLKSVMLPEVVLERRLHLENNGLRERDSRAQYLQVIRAAMERRKASSKDQ